MDREQSPASNTGSGSPRRFVLKTKPTQGHFTPSDSAIHGLRMQIKQLKNSLPTNTEMVHIMNVDPEKGNLLIENCRVIMNRIRELEDEERRAFQLMEQQKHETAKMRSIELYQERKIKLIDHWMDKELEAEDRCQELQQARAEKLKHQKHVKEALITEAKDIREQLRFVQKKRNMAKIAAWENHIVAMNRKREDQRMRWEHETHEKELNFEKFVQTRREKDANMRRRYTQYLEDSGLQIQLHAERAALLAEQRRMTGQRLARTTPVHPETFQLRQMERQEKLYNKALREQEQLEALQRQKEEDQSRLCTINNEKQKLAKQRIEQMQEEHQERLESLVRKMELKSRQLQEHKERQLEELRQARKSDYLEKTRRCKAANEHQKESQKIKLANQAIMRTMRMAQQSGVEFDAAHQLPPLIAPPPSSFLQLAENTNDRRTSNKPKSNAEDSSMLLLEDRNRSPHSKENSAQRKASREQLQFLPFVVGLCGNDQENAAFAPATYMELLLQEGAAQQDSGEDNESGDSALVQRDGASRVFAPRMNKTQKLREAERLRKEKEREKLYKRPRRKSPPPSSSKDPQGPLVISTGDNMNRQNDGDTAYAESLQLCLDLATPKQRATSPLRIFIEVARGEHAIKE